MKKRVLQMTLTVVLAAAISEDVFSLFARDVSGKRSILQK